jgi:serine/threonine-protein kinase SRPK3
MEILDDFLLHGPNGVHLSIITELLGPAIQQDEVI